LLSNSRNNSRRGIGPGMGMNRGADDSAGSSRTGTPPVKEKESHVHVNAYRYAQDGTPESKTSSNNVYSALAALDGDHPDDVASPPSTHASPAVTKAQPAAAGEVDAGKS